MKKFFFIFFTLLFFLGFKNSVLAQDYLVDYQVEYRPIKKENHILTKVDFNIKITHLRSDIYVNKFKLIFPENFKISGVEGKNNENKIDVNLKKVNFNNELIIHLTNPNVGKNSVNSIYISFYQQEIFKENGNIIEGIIPTIQDAAIRNYQAIVFLPKTFAKKISLSKPKPSLIKQNNDETIIYWNNPKEKSLYVVFGTEQYYQARLIYQLKNEQLYPVYQLVAFLPETAYQKVYINKISPSPVSVFMDDDGNLMGKYLLLPKKSLEVVFEGNIVISNNGNLEKIKYDQKQIKKQKKYLLSQTNYWQIKNIPQDNLSQPDLIYQFIVNNLDYNYQKVGKIKKRALPEEILINKKDAICLDYTDLFVTLARENGIASRAVIGYGYSQEQRLRPLSLQGDVLHSWPEYFDQTQLFWKSVDPTWEDTSGIDYFSSLDYNHIAFVILGKDSDKPLPAGMYQWDNQQKIFIKPTNEKPKEKILLKLEKLDFPQTISNTANSAAKFIIVNSSNVYLYNLPVTLTSNELDFDWQKKIIEVLPPYEQEEIAVKLIPKKKYKNAISLIKSEVKLDIGNYYRSQFKLTIIPLYFKVSIILIALSLTGGLIFVFLIKLKNKN